MSLKEWVIHFLKHQDLIRKDIQEIKDISSDELLVKRKSEDQTVLLIPDLAQEKILSEDKNALIITLNKRANIEFLVKNWGIICKKKKLTIIFVNPDSMLEIKWAIHPHTHNIVCDLESLRQGLFSIAENVEFIE